MNAYLQRAKQSDQQGRRHVGISHTSEILSCKIYSLLRQREQIFLLSLPLVTGFVVSALPAAVIGAFVFVMFGGLWFLFPLTRRGGPE